MLVPVLRPLTLGEVLDTSFGVYRNLFVPLAIVSAATQAVPLVVSTITEVAGGAAQQPGLWMLGIGLSLVLGAVGTAASTFLVAESYLGGSLTWQDAFLRSTPFFGRLIGASLLVSFIAALGLFALIIPGVILFCALFLTTPAIVLEDIPRITDAMGRSWSLTRGFRLKVFGAILVAFTLILVPSFALGAFAVLGEGSGSEMGRVVLFMFVQSVLQILIAPFLYVMTTVLYYDLRVRKEGLDLEMLATAMHQG
jgi:hypothetical protein